MNKKSIISPSIKMLIFSSMTKSKARFSANYSEFTVYMHPSSFIDSGTSSIRPHKAPPQILFLSIVSGQLNMGWLPSFYLYYFTLYHLLNFTDQLRLYPLISQRIVLLGFYCILLGFFAINYAYKVNK